VSVIINLTHDQIGRHAPLLSTIFSSPSTM